MKKVLITGVVGFIGTNLALRLFDLGVDVVGVDNLYTGSTKNLELLTKRGSLRFKFIKHDIRKPLELDRDFDVIFNLACPASPVHYQKDPVFTIETSFDGVRNMLKLMGPNTVLLHSSTSEIYGNPLQHPQKETYWGNVNPIGPRSCYDEGKRIAETLLYEAHNQGKDIRIVRIFNTYGPHMNPIDGRVITNFIMQALQGKKLTVYGDGSQTRSFQYIDDLIDGFLRYVDIDKQQLQERLSQNGWENVPVLNMGNPEERTIKELALLILQLLGRSQEDLVYKSLPQDDPLQRKPDISLVKAVLDWQPSVSLEQGLVRTVEYYRGIVGE